MRQIRKKDYKLLFLLVDLIRRGEYEKAKMYADRFYDEADVSEVSDASTETGATG